MMIVTRDDTVTFEQFFRAEYPRLVPMLRALTGDRQQAEDIAQESLWRARQHWATISDYDRPGAWVRRVALNLATNVHRSRQRETRAFERLHVLADHRDVELRDERLWELVRALPDQQRAAVVLHYVEDRSVAEIAHILECHEGTVKTHLTRARATLARQLSPTRTEQP